MSVSREVYEALTAQVHTLTAERDQLRARVAELEADLHRLRVPDGVSHKTVHVDGAGAFRVPRAIADRMTELEAENERNREWIARAVASCAQRQCSMRDRRLAELEAENARLTEQGRGLLIWIMRSHKASIGSIDSHYTPQLNIARVNEIAESFGLKP